MLGRLFLSAILVALLASMDSYADRSSSNRDDTSAGQNDPVVNPASARSRNVYKVDDVGLIIGGASEDAKAKVGRLRVQD